MPGTPDISTLRARLKEEVWAAEVERRCSDDLLGGLAGGSCMSEAEAALAKPDDRLVAYLTKRAAALEAEVAALPMSAARYARQQVAAMLRRVLEAEA